MIKEKNVVLMPVVIEQSGRGERVYDLPSKLMKERIVTLFGEVDEVSAHILVLQLLVLEGQDSEKPISLYINSPGGVISDGFAIYDTMKFLKCPVHTFCMGMAASMGAFLLGAGEPEHRYALPNARIMIHQPSGGARGQSTDIQIQAKEIQRLRSSLEGIISEYSGKSKEQVKKDCERDYYMTADDAKKYGIIDKVISSRKDMK